MTSQKKNLPTGEAMRKIDCVPKTETHECLPVCEMRTKNQQRKIIQPIDRNKFSEYTFSLHFDFEYLNTAI